MPKKIVMQDIADRLKISKNSVSQALSGKDGVSEETRRKVIRTAEEMGYQYERKRSRGGSKQARSIGLIASEFTFTTKTFFGDIFLAIEREAQQHNIRLLIQSVNPSARDTLTLPDFIDDRLVEGVLVLSHISTDYINKVISRDIPTVLVDHHHPLIQADAVLTNNRFGAYLAVKHLIDLGHRHIAVIGNTDASPSYQERWEGYMLALRDHGIEPRQDLMFVHVKEDETWISETVQSLRQQPSAWFCLNDGFAFFVCAALKHLGLRIPEDVSICGFDNSHFSQISDPKITTMDIDLDQFARKAFAQLLWRIKHPGDVHRETLLPTKLIRRESTDTCAGGGT
ncbi:substrate-binding domain-containing protein [Paenibacillus thermoaerophilus]|uniref:Substrate-binding domain-containing protein n=1 Tax=Paenibacillus thermoaerophilus TaxID=1215385 RepID=A0ABW2V021_9BACL|nr:substrate-binding domain-containing protein [Paenibacillus thermoaerophilus]TMV18249.1 LacI family DNA-binding transcriptional regulator [Paenibacillus thermoaerophilus]